MKLSKNQREILQRVYNHFAKNLNWPQNAKLGVEFRQLGNYKNLLKEIGRDYIDEKRDSNNAYCTVLTIRGIYECKNSKDTLQFFADSLRNLAGCYIREVYRDLPPIVTFAGIVDSITPRHQNWERILFKLMEYGHEGYWSLNNPPVSDRLWTRQSDGRLTTNALSELTVIGSDDNDSITLKEEILDFEHIKTIDDYLHIISKKQKVNEVTNRKDIFVSYASEDRGIAQPIADKLIENGITVWFDQYELKLGDNLRERIEKGLKNSRYGVTILSHNFFKKEWPQKELDGLFSLEGDTKKILPVWYKLSKEAIASYSPIIASRLGISFSEGVNIVVQKIVDVVKDT